MGTQPQSHDDWMARAVQEGLRGPAADANPRVGAVVLDRNGELAGVGHHHGAGTPHAEIEALNMAGARAAGGTVYVTLEPCTHTGRTGPCVEALIDARVGTVVHAVDDPSATAGGGARVLREAGITVLGGTQLLEDATVARAAEVARPWSDAVRLGRPRVIWKFAATLDGRTAAQDGSSRWITSPQARHDVHDLRARCGAVLVGTGTALADDPALTARRPDGTLLSQQPLRVVVGARDLPAGARLHDDSAPTLHLRTEDPAVALGVLHDREVRQVLLEGGPTLAASFWRAGLVDEVVAYLAPALLGSGAAAVANLGIATIADLARLEVIDLRQLGPDVRITARPTPASTADHPTLVTAQQLSEY